MISRFYFLIILIIFSSCGPMVKLTPDMISQYSRIINSGCTGALSLKPVNMNVDCEYYDFRIDLYRWQSSYTTPGNITYQTSTSSTHYSPGTAEIINKPYFCEGVNIGNGIFIDNNLNISFCPLKYFGENKNFKVLKNGERWFEKKGNNTAVNVNSLFGDSIITSNNNGIVVPKINVKPAYIDHIYKTADKIFCDYDFVFYTQTREFGIVSNVYQQLSGPSLHIFADNRILFQVDNNISTGSDFFGQNIYIKQSDNELTFIIKKNSLAIGNLFPGPETKVYKFVRYNSGIMFIDEDKDGIIADYSGNSIIVMNSDKGRLTGVCTYTIQPE